MKSQFHWLLILYFFTACVSRKQDFSGKNVALHTATAPQIDGIPGEGMWKDAAIYPIDQLWNGKLPFAADYMGRYRVCWDSSHLYLLIEIMDDSLIEKEDHIDIFIGNELPDQDPIAYSVYVDPDTSSVMAGHTDTLASNEHFVKRMVVTQNRLSTWEICIGFANSAGSIIPFALFYNDVDKPKDNADRMGSVPFRPDPDKSRLVVYADDLGELSLEIKEHK